MHGLGARAGRGAPDRDLDKVGTFDTGALTCLVALGRPEQAENALAEALSGCPSGRRRGAVLVDLATVGVLRRDPDHLAVSAYAALDVLRQTGSGYLARKLRGLRVAMRPHRADARVRSVDDAVAAALV